MFAIPFSIFTTPLIILIFLHCIGIATGIKNHGKIDKPKENNGFKSIVFGLLWIALMLWHSLELISQ